MPRISSPDRLPPRAVLPKPQTVEQLVDVPVLSLDECFLVQVVEQLKVPAVVSQQPRTVLFRGPDGFEWCRVSWPMGVLLVEGWYTSH